MLRGDAELYKIHAYLVIFRLSELGVEQFRCCFCFILLGLGMTACAQSDIACDCRQIVRVGDPQKMRVFLEFVIDTDTLVASCRDGWLSIYDQEVQRARTMK